MYKPETVTSQNRYSQNSNSKWLPRCPMVPTPFHFRGHLCVNRSIKRLPLDNKLKLAEFITDEFDNFCSIQQELLCIDVSSVDTDQPMVEFDTPAEGPLGAILIHIYVLKYLLLSLLLKKNQATRLGPEARKKNQKLKVCTQTKSVCIQMFPSEMR